MSYSDVHTIKCTSNMAFRVLTVSALCLLLPSAEMACRKRPVEPASPSPPDLSSCTRLEIRYPWGTANYFLPDTGIQESLLSPDEKEYIKSIDSFTVDDPERVKTFARDVSLTSYDRTLEGIRVDAGEPVYVECYRDNELMLSLEMGGNLLAIVNSKRPVFRYPEDLLDLEKIEPAEMQPFKLRYQCGSNMQAIYTSGPLYRKEVAAYPQSTEWCDAILRNRINTSYVSEDEMRTCFKCPTAGDGKCHYAMNPNCEPNSPPDTVLLFETEAGWNQNGGPELFTFDHHEPRGGCVMQNDGTVKFIRTKEELQQLRWE